MPPKKRKAKKKASPGIPRLSLFKTLLWTCVILLTGLSLFVAMHLPMRPAANRADKPAAPPASRPAPERPKETAPVTTPQRAAPTPPASTVYEAHSEDFEARVRNVDLAILQALEAQGGNQNIMRHKAVEARVHGGQDLPEHDHHPGPGSFRVSGQPEGQPGPPGTRGRIGHGQRQPPRPRDLHSRGADPPPLPAPEPVSGTGTPATRTARLVIVIDDLGESMATARRLADLPFKVSFSVLPHNTKARQVAELARREGLELLLHLPCEPDGYPKTANSGPGTLRVNMSEAALERALIDNLARLPEVDGVNNHMGSRLTRDARAMTVVLAHLKGRGKFFLDSLTTSKSCVRQVSSNLGMRYYRRHIFLDNSATEHAILLQLKKAESLARRTGTAVAIGHPYPETLSALESWAKTRDMDVTICTIQDI